MTKKQIRELFVREEKVRKQMLSPILTNIGLTPGQGQARILYYLLEKENISQKELADKCHFDAPAMSRNLDKLENMGFIKRENNPDSRRSFLIRFTPNGKEKAKEIKKTFDDFDNLLCKDISKEELEVFYQILSKMCVNMEENKDSFSR